MYEEKRSKRLRWATIGLSVLAICLLIVVIVLAVLIVLEKDDDDSTDSTSTPAPEPRRSDSAFGNYSDFGVASDNGVCSSIGRQILLKGGNAIDAAISVELCIGITDPHSAGVGGGFFLTFYNATSKKCTIIDAREMAPGNATQDMFVSNPAASSKGFLSIGVPGDIHGLYTAYSNFGSLPWKELLEPAISLARDGHPVSGSLANAIKSEEKYILEEPTLKSVFVNNETGLPFVAGEIIKRPQLAVTLQKLADSSNPIAEFYEGEMAKSIVEDIKSRNGLITMEDMKKYKAQVRQPIVTQLSSRGLIACGPPPPSGASIAMAILNILDGYNMTTKNLETFDWAVSTFHRIIEAQKFAYAMRSDLGDMDFVADAIEIATQVTSESWGSGIRNKITSVSHPTEYYGGDYENVKDHGTSHISVLDVQGNAVAVTTTINQYFGSQRRHPILGIIYNDEMDDFSTPNVTNGFGYRPSEANFIKPYKRPQSSMSPLIVYDQKSGAVRLIVGASGGSTIISAASYVAVHNLYLGANIKQSIDYPRIHNQLWPNVTKVESGFSSAYIDALQGLGQEFEIVDSVGSVSTGIERQGKRIQANSDFRKNGGFPAGR